MADPNVTETEPVQIYKDTRTNPATIVVGYPVDSPENLKWFASQNGVELPLNYKPVTGTEAPTIVEADIKASPLLAWTERELEDDELRKSDLKVIVPSKLIDEAGIDLKPASGAQVFCVRGTKKYKVLPVKIVESGDLEAIVILGLRK